MRELVRANTGNFLSATELKSDEIMMKVVSIAVL